MIKYRVDCGLRISEVEIERETDKFVVLNGGRREAKSSDCSNWLDSEADAKRFVFHRMVSNRDSIQRRIVNSEKDLENINVKIACYIDENPELKGCGD